MEMMPIRFSHLVLEPLVDETLVYNPATGKVHCLNQTASLVLQRCDGTTPQSEVVRSLEEALLVSHGKELLQETLSQLGELKLIGHTISRRRFGKLAAAAVPVIATLALPLPAAAASTCLNELAGSLCPTLTSPSGCIGCCNPDLAGQSVGSGCAPNGCPNCAPCFCGITMRCKNNNCCTNSCISDVPDFGINTNYCEKDFSTSVATTCVSGGGQFTCQRSCGPARAAACALAAQVYSCCQGCT